jgi:HK97 family phage major capsid protein
MADLALIEKALKQINENMATKAEVLELIQSEVKADEEKAKAQAEDFTAAQDNIKGLQQTVTNLNAQVKNMLSARLASVRGADGRYNGIWENTEQAKNFGYFVLAAIGNTKAKAKLDEVGIELKHIVGDEVKAMSEGEGTAGGFTVPPDFIPNLISLKEKYGVYRRNVKVWPMGSASSEAPKRTSGLTVYCPAAGVTLTPSDVSFGGVGLNAMKWITLTVIDSELDEDSAIAIGDLIGEEIAWAFAKQEDKSGFVGDGTKAYFNILGARAALRAVHATVGSVAGLHVQGTPGAWSAIVLDDVLGVTGLLPDYADDERAAYFCNKNFFLTVMVKLALAAGGSGAAEVTNTAFTRKPTFLGRRVDTTHVMPRTKPAADHCPLLLANLWQGAVMGDRRLMTIDQSKEAFFTTDQRGIRGTQRVAINNHGVGDDTDPGPIAGLWADIA